MFLYNNVVNSQFFYIFDFLTNDIFSFYSRQNNFNPSIVIIKIILIYFNPKQMQSARGKHINQTALLSQFRLKMLKPYKACKQSRNQIF
ncbi:hypothetical protein HMPREF9370_1409 [Neisseria wadsworthii 9715]|uniref:Uncharacterized protein n=1 Tax=Neisseria wadsworthii 9715 TaxID=1030841 RepID=G4CQP9_9NEIS|nr:hypothetical protein HMPREF9370_1409 [Neisseria wadsworthii 9715]